MQLRFIIEGIIEVPDEDVQAAYGTTDPEKCAKIEQENRPEDLLGAATQVTHNVFPAKFVIYDSSGLPQSEPLSDEEAKARLDRIIKDQLATDMWSIGPAWQS